MSAVLAGSQRVHLHGERCVGWVAARVLAGSQRPHVRAERCVGWVAARTCKR